MKIKNTHFKIFKKSALADQGNYCENLKMKRLKSMKDKMIMDLWYKTKYPLLKLLNLPFVIPVKIGNRILVP